MELYTLHLFAGAGGGILADEIMGFRTVGAVELEEYPRRVLLARQADGCLHRFPIWDDVCTFRADNPATRDYIDRLRAERDRLCICGGFPCQDISAAGKGAGITGARSGLWKEYARIVSEIRPAYVFMENSPLLVRRGLDVVLADLAEMRYSLAWGIVSAADVGAPHLRKRFWGLAISDSLRDREGRNGSLEEAATDKQERESSNSDSARQQWNSIGGDNEQTQFRPDELRRSLPDAGNKNNGRLYGEQEESDEQSKPDCGRKTFNVRRQRRQIEPRLGGVADGLDTWLDEVTTGRFWDAEEHGLPRLLEQCENRRKRLKAIGNGQVPLCAAVAFVTLLDRYIQFTQ